MSPLRADIVSAVIAIIAERGFEGLSMRTVAMRAGVSTGAVQHHFRTKSEMLRAAMEAISVAAAERAEHTETIGEPVERLHAIVDLLVPADAADPVARVWLAYAVRASTDDEIRGEYGRMWTRLRSGLAMLVAAATGRRDTAETDGAELLALLDGLALRVIAEHGSGETARAIAHRRVDELVGGSSRPV